MLSRAGKDCDAPRLGAACRKRPCTPFLDDATDLSRLTLDARSAKFSCRWSRIIRDRVAAEHLGVPDDAVWRHGQGANRSRAHEGNIELFTQRLSDDRRLGKQLSERFVESLDQSALRTEVCGELQRFERNIPKSTFRDSAKKALHASLAKKIDRLLGVADEKYRLGVAVP